MTNRIIELRCQLSNGVQAFPAGHKFDLDNTPKKFVDFLRATAKKTPQIFCGDIAAILFGESECEVPETFDDLKDKTVDELKLIAATLKLKGWAICSKKDTLLGKIKPHYDALEAQEEAGSTATTKEVEDTGADGGVPGTAPVVKRADIEIIEQNDDMVKIKATEAILAHFPELKDVKAGEDLELEKAEFDEKFPEEVTPEEK